MKKPTLEKIGEIARDFQQQGRSESTAVGEFVEMLISNFSYDGTSEPEAIQIVLNSLEELKGSVDAFLKAARA